jgi:predicted MFS family arabinose efflux permease
MYLGTSLGAAAGSALLAGPGFRVIPVAGAAAGLLGALICARFAITETRTAAA